VARRVGVALVLVEHLQGSKIDGASFRLDNRTPDVALSLAPAPRATENLFPLARTAAEP